MTIKNSHYVLSETDKKKIEAHARAIAKRASYDGAVEAWLDSEAGEVSYMECVGLDYYVPESDTMECICRVRTPAR